MLTGAGVDSVTLAIFAAAKVGTSSQMPPLGFPLRIPKLIKTKNTWTQLPMAAENPNGANIDVTEENKMDYVRLICEHKLIGLAKEQIEAFLKGETCCCV